MPENQAAQSPKDAANAAKTTAGIANKARQLVSTIKKARLALAAAGGPAGWAVGGAMALGAVLGKYAKQIKRIIAAAYALLLAILLWLLAKFLGVFAGIAFGLVTGLPLLLVPGVGPFLYAGWVGYWAYKGWTDPLGTIHLATHPWEAITKPLGAVKNFFANVGSGAQGTAEYVTFGVSKSIGSAISAAGSAITGAASSLWGVATSAIGNGLGWLGSGLGEAFHALTTTGGALVGNAAAIGVVGGGVAIATTSIFIGNTQNSAFFTAEGDLSGEIITPGDNSQFTITKTASPSSLGAPGADVTFTVTITPKSQAIASVGFIDNFRYSKGGTETPLTFTIPPNPCTLPIAVGSPCTFTHTFNTFLIPTDSLLINSVVASATLADGTIKSDSATVSVPIGAPVSNCPQGWPTGAGSITQGIQGATSHFRLFPTEEAIDIGGATITDTPTFSTFTGTVTNINPIDDNGYGIFVDVEGLCNGAKFTARWAHLNSVASSVAEGGTINKGSPIGKVDSTGHVTGPHLHYSFFGLHMSSPNIPQTPPNICDDSVACGVSW